MTQLDLLDGLARQKHGIARVALHNEEFVRRMRLVANRLYASDGFVTSDELRFEADRLGIAPDHQNAWGAVFRCADWEAHGRIRSRYPSNHARWITVWRRR